jgi:hypothetical protein
MKISALDSLPPDVAVHRAPQSLYGIPQKHAATPGQILYRNLNRTPLRCDVGEVRQDFGLTQAHAQVARAVRQ